MRALDLLLLLVVVVLGALATVITAQSFPFHAALQGKAQNSSTTFGLTIDMFAGAHLVKCNEPCDFVTAYQRGTSGDYGIWSTSVDVGLSTGVRVASPWALRVGAPFNSSYAGVFAGTLGDSSSRVAQGLSQWVSSALDPLYTTSPTSSHPLSVAAGCADHASLSGSSVVDSLALSPLAPASDAFFTSGSTLFQCAGCVTNLAQSASSFPMAACGVATLPYAASPALEIACSPSDASQCVAFVRPTLVTSVGVAVIALTMNGTTAVQGKLAAQLNASSFPGAQPLPSASGDWVSCMSWSPRDGSLYVCMGGTIFRMVWNFAENAFASAPRAAVSISDSTTMVFSALEARPDSASPIQLALAVDNSLAADTAVVSALAIVNVTNNMSSGGDRPPGKKSSSPSAKSILLFDFVFHWRSPPAIFTSVAGLWCPAQRTNNPPPDSCTAYRVSATPSASLRPSDVDNWSARNLQVNATSYPVGPLVGMAIATSVIVLYAGVIVPLAVIWFSFEEVQERVFKFFRQRRRPAAAADAASTSVNSDTPATMTTTTPYGPSNTAVTPGYDETPGGPETSGGPDTPDGSDTPRGDNAAAEAGRAGAAVGAAAHPSLSDRFWVAVLHVPSIRTEAVVWTMQVLIACAVVTVGMGATIVLSSLAVSDAVPRTLAGMRPKTVDDFKIIFSLSEIGSYAVYTYSKTRTDHWRYPSDDAIAQGGILTTVLWSCSIALAVLYLVALGAPLASIMWCKKGNHETELRFATLTIISGGAVAPALLFVLGVVAWQVGYGASDLVDSVRTSLAVPECPNSAKALGLCGVRETPNSIWHVALPFFIIGGVIAAYGLFVLGLFVSKMLTGPFEIFRPTDVCDDDDDDDHHSGEVTPLLRRIRANLAAAEARS